MEIDGIYREQWGEMQVLWMSYFPLFVTFLENVVKNMCNIRKKRKYIQSSDEGEALQE